MHKNVLYFFVKVESTTSCLHVGLSIGASILCIYLVSACLLHVCMTKVGKILQNSMTYLQLSTLFTCFIEIPAPLWEAYFQDLRQHKIHSSTMLCTDPLHLDPERSSGHLEDKPFNTDVTSSSENYVTCPQNDEKWSSPRCGSWDFQLELQLQSNQWCLLKTRLAQLGLSLSTRL